MINSSKEQMGFPEISGHEMRKISRDELSRMSDQEKESFIKIINRINSGITKAAAKGDYRFSHQETISNKIARAISEYYEERDFATEFTAEREKYGERDIVIVATTVVW